MENKFFFIDNVKVILAIFVVILHSGPGYYIEPICNIAVPLFFSFSGFFYGKTSKGIIHFTKRILLLYFFWLIVQWPLSLPMIKNEPSLLDIARHVIFSSSYPVSWYLISLIWSAVLLIVLKRFGYWYVALTSCILYVMCVAELGWAGYFNGTWLYTFNETYKTIFGTIAWSFPQAFIFFAIGYYINSNKSKNYYTVFSLLAVVLYGAEYHYVNYYHLCGMSSALFTLPLLIYGLTGLCLRNCHATPYKEKGKLLREISTLIYLSHPVLMAIGFKLLGISTGMSRIFFVFALFIPLCFLYFKLRKLKYLRWLKYAC